jgi:type II restriction/modification system DNA methylase subunit YeeA
MNTNILKKFAQEANKKLVAQIGAKMDYVLNTDSVELREKEDQIKRLKEEIAKTSKAQVIDKVAYTWFNRLMALRFMDVNDFQPLGVRVISPKDGFTTPELLEEVKQGHIPADLLVKKDRIFDLLDGKIPSPNPQNEVFKELLIGACNHLHKTLPFLFERINDYTDLLLPDDLISEFSIVQDIRNGMSAEDCKEVEIIGWLYQFYISEKKDQVFASGERVKKEDIPAATQLFTPRWIVEYMVQNTIGKLWLQNRPNSKLKEHMPYYIESASVQESDYLKIKSVEEIKLLDQACGSGHILVYGFDLIYKIYEEEGYGPQEIPKLILEKNLFGFEIDERAAQLASMALMMKARSYSRRLFRDAVTPHILCYEDLRLSKSEIDDTFRQIGVKASDGLMYDLKTLGKATNLGSLIYPHSTLAELQTLSAKLQEKSNTTDAFLSFQITQLQTAVHQLIHLGEKYHCVADNPPYMGGGNMNNELADFVKINYPKSKADLMACFMEAGLKVLQPKGFLGMINQHSWMFLSSYEDLRKDLIKNTFFDTLLHLGPRTFPEIGGEVVQNAAFTFWNNKNDSNGRFIRLVDIVRSDLKREKTLEAIQNPACEWFFQAIQKDFEKIPGSPIGYWLTGRFFQIFNEGSKLNNTNPTKKGMDTANNSKYLRFWNEVNFKEIEIKNYSEELYQANWIPYQKGGSFRRWFGNLDHIINWKNKGNDISHERGTLRNTNYYFNPSLSWTEISSGKFCIRSVPVKSIFDATGPSIFGNNLEYINGLLNSKIMDKIMEIISPTLHFNVGAVASVPIKFEKKEILTETIKSNVNISKIDWDTKETSWSYNENELVRIFSEDLEESFDIFQQHWKNKFFHLHRNEEELNCQFIDIYGLQDELTPDVPLEEITILQHELDRESLKAQNSRLERDSDTGLVRDYSSIELKFDSKEVFAQFISYAVGCMFGRYSLDKDGLILANQGETLEDYLSVIATEGKQSPTFLPDEDNIIPILDDEWFEDDIVSRFKEFLRVTFGKENLEKNLAFLESAIGKDIRKYFGKDFYTDHIQRYKKRPIYWMFSSPNGSFNVLIYMHRYTPDTLSKILNDYLNQYREKLRARVEHLDQVMISGSSTEQTKAAKEKDKIRAVLLELQEYERDILYPLATERITIDLDEGVLVNYNKFGKAIKEVAGLNDKKAKAKVREFDWIDISTIR